MLLLLATSSKQNQVMEQMGFRAGVDFYTVDTILNEKYPQNLNSSQAIEKGKTNALSKIRNALQNRIVDRLELPPYDTVIVSSETVVVCNDQVVNATVIFPQTIPQDELDVQQINKNINEMLSQICGKTIKVISILCFAQADNIKNHVFGENMTQVLMKEYTNQNIQDYLKYNDELIGNIIPFAIDGRGVFFVASIDGSYTSLLGLPIEELHKGFQTDICAGRVPPLGKILRWEPPFKETGYSLKLLTVGDVSLELNFIEELSDSLSQFSKERTGAIKRIVGGDAARFAIQACRQGFPKVSVFSSIGDDFFGQEIIRQLSKEGIYTELIGRKSDQLSDLAITLSWHGQDIPIKILDSRSIFTIRDIDSIEKHLKRADILYISGRCLKDRRKEAIRRVLQVAYQTGIKTLLELPCNIEKELSFDQLSQDIQPFITLLVMNEATLQYWLNIQSEITKLPKELHTLCEVSVLRREEKLWLLTKDLRVDISSFRHEETDLNRFSEVQPIVALLYQLMTPRVLLASRSPRRVELLRQIMAPNKFEIFPSRAEEDIHQHDESFESYLKRNALRKAHWVRSHVNFSPYIKVILGADTNIVFNYKAIVQAFNEQEATSILNQLSGTTHYVMTGIALLDVQNSREIVDCVTTEVRMRKLSPDEIAFYVSTQEPIGKAGAYGIQGLAATLIESIKGSYSNVVGLPLERTIEILQRDFGVSIWNLDSVNAWKP